MRRIRVGMVTRAEALGARLRLPGFAVLAAIEGRWRAIGRSDEGEDHGAIGASAASGSKLDSASAAAAAAAVPVAGSAAATGEASAPGHAAKQSERGQSALDSSRGRLDLLEELAEAGADA